MAIIPVSANFCVKKNHKWKTGFVNLQKSTSEMLKWKKQVVHLLLVTEEDLDASEERLIEKIRDFKDYLKKQQEVSKLIEKMRGIE